MNSLKDYRFFYAMLHCILMLNVCFGKVQDWSHTGPQCGAETNENLLDISMSPGFLAGALPYAGHHDCTEDGVCRNIPFICPESSCCISNTDNVTLSLQTSLVSSHCGCWDSGRKACKPVRSFRLGSSTTCDEEGGAWVRSQFELAQTSTKICNGNTSTEINLSNDGKELRIGITITACSTEKTRQKRLALLLTNQNFNNVGKGKREIVVANRTKENLLSLIRNSSIQASLSPANVENFTETPSNVSNNYENHQLHQHHKRLALQKCNNDVVFATISMCPSFLPEALNPILNTFSGECGNQGTCLNYNESCSTTSCCLISPDREFHGCDCVSTNQEDCILDHKVSRIKGVACTINGERVQTELNVRIPSNVSDNCNGENSSWPMTSVNFKLHGTDNVELTVEKRHCVVTNSLNKEYLEVEEIMRAEINKDKLTNTLENISE